MRAQDFAEAAYEANNPMQLQRSASRMCATLQRGLPPYLQLGADILCHRQQLAGPKLLLSSAYLLQMHPSLPALPPCSPKLRPCRICMVDETVLRPVEIR